MSLAKSNKPPSAEVKQENKIAQQAINHFSLYKLTDTIGTPESGSQSTCGILVMASPTDRAACLGTRQDKIQLKGSGKYACNGSPYQ